MRWSDWIGWFGRMLRVESWAEWWEVQTERTYERFRGWWAERRRQRRRRQSLGGRGERAAAKYLRRMKRMVIVGRSVRIGRGEIDLVAVDQQTVVFVEVKTRQSHATGHPAEAVDNRKQIQLTRLALQYLKRHGLLEYSWRFDIVAVTWPSGVKRPTIQHLEGAFQPCGVSSMFT